MSIRGRKPRAWFQASSANSDSAKWPEEESRIQTPPNICMLKAGQTHYLTRPSRLFICTRSSIDRWRLDPHLGQGDDEKQRGKGKRRLLIFLIPINPRAHLLRASLNLVPRVFSFSNRAEKTQRTRLVLPLLKKLG